MYSFDKPNIPDTERAEKYRRRKNAVAAALLFAALPALGAILLALAPSLGWLCPFNSATGLLCPACGLTRAAYALLRGDVAAAAALNPAVFLIFAYPSLAAWAVTSALKGRRLGRKSVFATTAAILLWTLLRNVL